MEAFMQALDDPDSNYAKNYGDGPGDRSRDNNCLHGAAADQLLRPLCFESDETISEITLDVVKRLSDLRAVAATWIDRACGRSVATSRSLPTWPRIRVASGRHHRSICRAFGLSVLRRQGR